ncbi:unnamed protein product, partial [Effrenium voratum]
RARDRRRRGERVPGPGARLPGLQRRLAAGRNVAAATRGLRRPRGALRLLRAPPPGESELAPRGGLPGRVTRCRRRRRQPAGAGSAGRGGGTACLRGRVAAAAGAGPLRAFLVPQGRGAALGLAPSAASAGLKPWAPGPAARQGA